MKTISNERFDEERALYGESDLKVISSSFDGPKDGESAFKECRNIEVKHCFFNLRYPFWHNTNLSIEGSEMTDKCRAALWYSTNIEIRNTKMHGIKALRECENVRIENCDIISPEFGWSTRGIRMTDTTAESEYFMMRAYDLDFKNVTFSGKYSFQYIENGYFENCSFDTKDAFWHAHNVTVRDSVIKGEYLAWYSDGLTLINCRIIGTQPLCYAKNLRLIDCEMIETDLAFEKSDVNATLKNRIISIKNPSRGRIELPGVDEIIMDDKNAEAEIVITGEKDICA